MTNKFISILEKIGHSFKLGAEKAIAVEAQLLPLESAIAGGIGLVNPGAGVTLQGLVAVVGRVEQIATAVNATTGTGAQKLEAAIPGVEQAILSDPLFKGKTPANLDLYNKAVIAITSALADLTNSFASGPAPVTAPVPAVILAAPAK